MTFDKEKPDLMRSVRVQNIGFNFFFSSWKCISSTLAVFKNWGNLRWCKRVETPSNDVPSRIFSYLIWKCQQMVNEWRREIWWNIFENNFYWFSYQFYAFFTQFFTKQKTRKTKEQNNFPSISMWINNLAILRIVKPQMPQNPFGSFTDKYLFFVRSVLVSLICWIEKSKVTLKLFSDFKHESVNKTSSKNCMKRKHFSLPSGKSIIF